MITTSSVARQPSRLATPLIRRRYFNLSRQMAAAATSAAARRMASRRGRVVCLREVGVVSRRHVVQQVDTSMTMTTTPTSPSSTGFNYIRLGNVIFLAVVRLPVPDVADRSRRRRRAGSNRRSGGEGLVAL